MIEFLERITLLGWLGIAAIVFLAVTLIMGYIADEYAESEDKKDREREIRKKAGRTHD